MTLENVFMVTLHMPCINALGTVQAARPARHIQKQIPKHQQTAASKTVAAQFRVMNTLMLFQNVLTN